MYSYYGAFLVEGLLLMVPFPSLSFSLSRLRISHSLVTFPLLSFSATNVTTEWYISVQAVFKYIVFIDYIAWCTFTQNYTQNIELLEYVYQLM